MKIVFLFIISISTYAMQISENGKDFIKRYEGFRNHRYLGPDSCYYIGYGFKAGNSNYMTREYADSLFDIKIKRYEKAVSVIEGLNQNQFDALVSLAYTIGSVPKGIKNAVKNKMDVGEEIKKYIHSKGKVLPGLVRRRKAEANLYNKDDGGK